MRNNPEQAVIDAARAMDRALTEYVHASWEKHPQDEVNRTWHEVMEAKAGIVAALRVLDDAPGRPS